MNPKIISADYIYRGFKNVCQTEIALLKKLSNALLIFTLCAQNLLAQKTATLSGNVSDKADKSGLIGVTVILKGTSFGGVSDIDGNYKINNLPAGTYNIEFSYVGYEKTLFTGIKISEGEQKKLDVQLSVSAITLDDHIVIIGEKPLVDVEDAKSNSLIGKDQIEYAPSRPVQGIINTSAGVVQNAEGIHIRGGRTYETGFYIDDVSSTDPLAGTGFGIDLGSNAIEDISVNTSSSSVEYGNSTSGIVNAKTKSGSDKFSLNASSRRDNFGFNTDWNSVFNQSVYELGMGGPVKFKKKSVAKLKYFSSVKINFTDNYFEPANQVISSVYPDSSWSPYEDNRWAGMLKLNYDFSSVKKLSFTYLKSITINQDYNMLRVTGNDVGFSPGYQYNFLLQPDNANTYTHDTNLESLVWMNTPKPSFSYRITASRLFVHLRADANGREWRPQQVNSEFYPASIVTFPVQYFNPADSIVFVLPGPGLFNNDGIATLWHDHYVEEYSLKSSATFYSKNTFNRFYVGGEFRRREMQWIDISRPWIGAPIELPDGNYTQSFRLGDLSDAWHVVPVHGAFYVSDKFKFRGLIADLGLRYEYWFAGKFADDAIENPDALIADEVRDEYLKHTVNIFGSRMKMRLLPKLAASFPIKENQVMYFNYGHSMVEPHPSYIYTGLDPYYSDRSSLARIGNPDLNPEVDISYELGLKSQITNNDALNIAAYWKDKYDFITSTTILLKDVTGREVSRTFRINSDYARVRGFEIAYIKRIAKWFNSQVSFSYSSATGQSSSASQSIEQIVATGNSYSTKETPLAWDSPIDAKWFSIFTVNKKDKGLFNTKVFNHFSFYSEAIFRTGKRYTPYLYEGTEEYSGRPIYNVDGNPEHRYQKISSPSFWLNANLKKWFTVSKMDFAFSLEVTNILNNKNTLIVNPVTGSAYKNGDAVPSDWRDPNYIDPRDYRSYNAPPDNPARYDARRHFLFGLAIKFR